MSVAGGLPYAIARAQVHQCEALQIFTKNANQWRAKPLDGVARYGFPESVRRHFERLDGYLFLAPDATVRLLEDELRAAHRAGR